jgi:hypothetical protein
MKVFLIVLFVGLSSFALIKAAGTDAAQDKIIAAVGKLKTDHIGGKVADAQLIDDLTTISGMMKGHLSQVPAENQSKVSAFISQVEVTLKNMQMSKKFDPIVLTMFEAFGKSMSPAA